jgi:tRNA (cmo5U34)-methyltransferase
MKKDNIFAEPVKKTKDFSFDEITAVVFDDMLERSVPFYNEIQRMIVEITRKFAQDGKVVYDLGCSTGTTLINLMKNLDNFKVSYMGIDSWV